MRLVIQRVLSASVEVGEKKVGEIGKGLLVLVGVGENDTQKDAKELALKISNLRIMADKEDKMNLSVPDVDGSYLVISQFTLHADTKKGNRPSFIKAAKPELAKNLYEMFVDELRKIGQKVETGRFGEYMKISSKLDGPVTILIDSENYI